MPKVVSHETKCNILKRYKHMKQDRPDMSYDELVGRRLINDVITEKPGRSHQLFLLRDVKCKNGLLVEQIKRYEYLKKKELWNILKPFRQDYNKLYVSDELLKQYGHQVLRLPPYHCEFNPIELAWHITKDHYNNINFQTSTQKTENLWRASLSQCSQEMWQNFCMHCERLVTEQWEREMGQMSFQDIPPFIISLVESDSDDEIFDSDTEMMEED